MVFRILFLALLNVLNLSLTATELSAESLTKLQQSGWDKRAGQNTAIWISAAAQKLTVIKNGSSLITIPCSTSSKGIGSRANSNQTPLGWHIVAERIGEGLPWGAIFEERRFTGKIWSPTTPSTDDLILTRIIRLQGTEQGLNKGIGIDSYERFIYIHGTSEENKLGTPASHGCIRVSNSDVIRLFNMITVATPILITQW